MAEEVKRYSPSGERVLAVATEVFYREGIRSTSMDSVVAPLGGVQADGVCPVRV